MTGGSSHAVDKPTYDQSGREEVGEIAMDRSTSEQDGRGEELRAEREAGAESEQNREFFWVGGGRRD